LKIKPVCVLQSNWRCTVVDDNTVRLGFCVVNGLQQGHAEELVRQREDRKFESLEDFKRRVPLSKEELRTLAELGAFNCFSEHRRAAMWEVEETWHDDLLDRGTLGSARVSRAGFGVPSKQSFERLRTRHGFCASRKVRDGEDALANVRDACAPQTPKSPLAPMTLRERVRADYETMNLTTGPHPMKLLRGSLPNIWRAIDLSQAPHGATVQIAGNVICRQRPGTAKGFVFISLEDETGVSNAIVEPDLFERFRLLITEEAFLVIEGEVQNSDGVVLIKTRDIRPLIHEALVGSESHDFH